MNEYFNISIFRALLEIKDNEYKEIEEIDSFIKIQKLVNRNADYDTAYSLLEDYPLLVAEEVEYLKTNSLVLLYLMMRDLNPDWLREIKKGRESFYKYMNEKNYTNIIQVFDFCNLDSDSSQEVSIWWKLFYQANFENFNKVISGIEAEQKTKIYENRVLKKFDMECIDMSIHNPSAGYDVLSYRENDQKNIYEIYIEAKSDKNYSNSFYLTRNEFNQAERYKEAYIIYLWRGDDSQPRKIYFEELEKNTPKDRGGSEWKEAFISLD